MDTIIGIVLAGGKSRRFGSPKAFAELNGVPFYCYPVQILSRLCSSVYVVARQQDFDRFNLRKKELLMEDHPDFLGEGPLAGLYTVMNQKTSNWYVVLPIDTPFIHLAHVAKLIEESDGQYQAIIPIVNGVNQPLIALYHHSVKNLIMMQLQRKQRSMKALLEKLHVKYVHFPEADSFHFININDHKEWKKIQQASRGVINDRL
ncbi:molybdenum cofactor guanylyltransferase [Gracilibacillus dipsosauri]|uniref:Probable molybdenum cofactor guanylyltransferase n=2 Tax=Gracilibacillus TaxID=74385 RepID=A0A317KXT9_9BACI|nr:molybdenum cofactor guanylyltransferase [Gracilibacillus dipsosauri]PWU68146.1 molybdenum cofactor guanylyltransferase [Gracilibacillus dipsosauri]